jgi:uncharacterized protein (UPF0264 family)
LHHRVAKELVWLKLLISPVNEQEALEAIRGGADIIDVKNPHDGPFGACFPWTIKRIREMTPETVEVSCTLGDLPNLPGSIALAAAGAASLGVDYVKVSLLNFKREEDGVYVMQNAVKAVRNSNRHVKVVAAGFADAGRVGSLNPLFLPRIAASAECDFAMVDTAVKDGQNLFDFLGVDQLKAFVTETHDCGLKVAFAGSLKIEHLPVLSGLGVDVVGLRSAACTGGDRIKGHVTEEKVRKLVKFVAIEKGTVSVR